MNTLRCFLIGLTLLGCTSAIAERHQTQRKPLSIGEVSFPISCSKESNHAFNQALAMLHSFGYPEARKAFTAITKTEPDCAMAYWGVAISYFQQIWSKPLPAENLKARALLETARRIGRKTELEQRYIQILTQFYENSTTDGYINRLQSYEDAMAELSATYPEHNETAIFYALSLLASAYSSPPDTTYAKQLKAGAILEDVYKRASNHPGVVHYIIHSYDYPELAERGLKAARHYAIIAPDAPHALHMPGHIFTRLGYWQDSISSNTAAAESARANNWSGEQLHASDYLVYAYMQAGQYQEALGVVQKIPAILTHRRQNEGAGDTYSSQAAQARYAVELRDWKLAATLAAPDNNYNKSDLCRMNASIHFARGLGAAHLSNDTLARESITALQSCKDILSNAGQPTQETGSLNNQLWHNLIEAQRAGVLAQLAMQHGETNEALRIMREAADIEDATDKPPSTPGAISPARELLGDLLLASGQPQKALAEYEITLKDSQNRLRSIHGAAKAAAAIKDSAKATKYYQQLLDITQFGNEQIAERVEAQAYLSALGKH